MNILGGKAERIKGGCFLLLLQKGGSFPTCINMQLQVCVTTTACLGMQHVTMEMHCNLVNLCRSTRMSCLCNDNCMFRYMCSMCMVS